jgi:hypothetical protein
MRLIVLQLVPTELTELAGPMAPLVSRCVHTAARLSQIDPQTPRRVHIYDAAKLEAAGMTPEETAQLDDVWFSVEASCDGSLLSLSLIEVLTALRCCVLDVTS